MKTKNLFNRKDHKEHKAGLAQDFFPPSSLRSLRSLWLKFLPLIFVCVLCGEIPAQTPPTNHVATTNVSVQVNTNGVLISPTNLFDANTNLLYKSLTNLGFGSPGSYQPSSANLSNLSSLTFGSLAYLAQLSSNNAAGLTNVLANGLSNSSASITLIWTNIGGVRALFNNISASNQTNGGDYANGIYSPTPAGSTCGGWFVGIFGTNATFNG